MAKKSKLDITDLMTRISARQFQLMTPHVVADAEGRHEKGTEVVLVIKGSGHVAAGPFADFEVLALLAKLDQEFNEDTCSMHTPSRRWAVNRTCTCAVVFRTQLRDAWKKVQANTASRRSDPAA